MRRCGDCTICCTLTQVPEFDKPAGLTCLHCRKDGCSVYATRPNSCRDFQCAWLMGELPSWMRPDKVHVMVERLSDHLLLAIPEPGHETTWRTPEITEQLVENYQKLGDAVVSLPDHQALIPNGHTADEVSQAVATLIHRSGAIL